MDRRNAYTASATACSVRVAIVDGQIGFPASSAGPVLQRRPLGRLTRVGFGRVTQLGLMATNATIWTWVAALPTGLI
jgi:hypothetical protein